MTCIIKFKNHTKMEGNMYYTQIRLKTCIIINIFLIITTSLLTHFFTTTFFDGTTEEASSIIKVKEIDTANKSNDEEMLKPVIAYLSTKSGKSTEDFYEKLQSIKSNLSNELFKNLNQNKFNKNK